MACYNVNEHNSILSPQTLQFFCSLVVVNLTFEVLGLNTRVEQPASLEVLISLNSLIKGPARVFHEKIYELMSLQKVSLISTFT